MLFHKSFQINLNSYLTSIAFKVELRPQHERTFSFVLFTKLVPIVKAKRVMEAYQI